MSTTTGPSKPQRLSNTTKIRQALGGWGVVPEEDAESGMFLVGEIRINTVTRTVEVDRASHIDLLAGDRPTILASRAFHGEGAWAGRLAGYVAYVKAMIAAVDAAGEVA